MVDDFRGAPRQIGDPASKAFSITPTDDVELAQTTRGLYVGGAGDISLKMVGDDTAVPFKGVTAGSLLPLRVKEVRATGTTATFIVGVY